MGHGLLTLLLHPGDGPPLQEIVVRQDLSQVVTHATRSTALIGVAHAVQ